jgi:hypothetical protein
MLPSLQLTRAAAIVAVAAFAAIPIAALASPPSGVTFTTLTVQNFDDPDEINSDKIKFQTKEPTITRIQSATWDANSTSGWHNHPGVILGVVTSGTVTVWDGNCGQKTYGPGQPLGAVFVEGDDEIMQATSSGGATEYVVHVVPKTSPPVFRLENDPPPCATATLFRQVPTKR